MLTIKRNKSYKKITVWLIALLGGFASSYGLLSVVTPLGDPAARSAVKGDSIVVGMQKPNEEKQLAPQQPQTNQQSNDTWQSSQPKQTAVVQPATTNPVQTAVAPTPQDSVTVPATPVETPTEPTPAETPTPEENGGLLGGILDGVTDILPGL